MSMKKQRGATVVGMIFVAALVVMVAMVVIKLMPAYLEFFSVKKVLNAMATSGELKTMSPRELQASFIRRASVDDDKNVKPEDLSIAREGDTAVVSVEYSVKVPIVANVSACLDFSASTRAGGE